MAVPLLACLEHGLSSSDRRPVEWRQLIRPRPPVSPISGPPRDHLGTAVPELSLLRRGSHLYLGPPLKPPACAKPPIYAARRAPRLHLSVEMHAVLSTVLTSNAESPWRGRRTIYSWPATWCCSRVPHCLVRGVRPKATRDIHRSVNMALL